MTASVNDQSEWLEGEAARRILDVPSARNVRELARRGLIGVRNLPGVRAVYRRADVERLAKESVRPSQQPASKGNRCS